MLTIPIPQSRRNKRKTIRSASLPAPVLLSGTIDEESGLTLTFDQPVAIKNFKGAALVVNDPATGAKYQGTGTPTVTGAGVRIAVEIIGSASGNKILLNASADSGIVSSASDIPWPGVANCELSIK